MFWVLLGAGVGYLVGETKGAVVGGVAELVWPVVQSGMGQIMHDYRDRLTMQAMHASAGVSSAPPRPPIVRGNIPGHDSSGQSQSGSRYIQ